jgi:hypothetical protein
MCQRLVHEYMPRHLTQRAQHLFIANALLAQPLHHALARAL